MKDKKYIKKIIIYCNKIARYLDGVSSIEVFEAYDEKVDAVLLNLELIGETAKIFPKDFKNNTTTIEVSYKTYVFSLEFIVFNCLTIK